MPDRDSLISRIQSIFLGASGLDAESVLNLASIFTFDGTPEELKMTLSKIPDHMIQHLDSKFNMMVEYSELTTVAKLFRLEWNKRSGNLEEDYILKNHPDGIKITYKSRLPIIGFESATHSV